MLDDPLGEDGLLLALPVVGYVLRLVLMVEVALQVLLALVDLGGLDHFDLLLRRLSGDVLASLCILNQGVVVRLLLVISCDWVLDSTDLLAFLPRKLDHTILLLSMQLGDYDLLLLLLLVGYCLGEELADPSVEELLVQDLLD